MQKALKSVDAFRQAAAIFDNKSLRFLDFNDKLLQLFGYESKEEMLALDTASYLYNQQFKGLTSRQLITQALKHFEDNEVFVSTIIGLKKDGNTMVLELCILRNYFDDENITSCFFKETEDPQLSEKMLLEKNTIYQTLIKGSFDFIDIVEFKVLNREQFLYDAKLISRSNSMKKVLGIENEIILSRNEIIHFTPQSYIKTNLNRLPKLVKQLRNNGYAQFDWEVKTKEQETIMLNIVAYYFNIQDKNYLVRIMRNITSSISYQALIEEQNNKLLEKNKQLEEYIESNIQLENFAYIASHDIKAPLRTLRGFTNILHEKLRNRLNSEEKTLFNFIVESSRDINQLVTDLLEFSQISNNPLKIMEIDTVKLLNGVIANLSASIQERKAEIVLQELPAQFKGDRIKIVRVFQNLLQNAIKFSKEYQHPVIHISGKELADKWIFSVKDNGIGIAEEAKESIFLMFRKLNGKNFTGSGIGLAICKKIVEQHKGNIQVHSSFGVGTEFIFSIAKDTMLSYKEPSSA